MCVNVCQFFMRFTFRCLYTANHIAWVSNYFEEFCNCQRQNLNCENDAVNWHFIAFKLTIIKSIVRKSKVFVYQKSFAPLNNSTTVRAIA